MTLVAQWTLDGVHTDSSGNGFNFSTSGTPTSVNAQLNTGYDFSSSYDYITPTNLELRYNMTIAFWIKLNAYPASRMGIMQTAYGAEIALNVTSTGSLQWYYGTSGGFAAPYVNHGTAAGALPVGEWTHVALVRNLVTNRCEYYINGELLSSSPLTYQCAKYATRFQIGYAYTGYLNGALDDVRIYDEVLSVSEIKELSRGLCGYWKCNGNAKDSSICGNDGSLGGGTWTTNTPRNQQAYYTNTATDEITTTATNLSNLKAGTVSFWMYPRYVTGYRSAVGCRNGSTGWMFYRNSVHSAYKFYMLHYANPTYGWTEVTVPVNAWSHIIAQWDESGYSRMWLNGVVVDTHQISSFVSWYTNTTALQIARGGTGHDFHGNMSDVKVYSSYLSDEDCLALYKNRAKLSNTGDLMANNLVETKYPDLVTDYNVWTVSNGTIGSFSANGTTAENVRATGTGPFGESTILWGAVPDATKDADGGWNHNVTLDAGVSNAYRVRYSVWIKRTGDANGNTYLGCDPGDVYTLGGLTINNNPYFWDGDPPNYTDWFLYVGNVFPYSYGLSTKHSESGIYNTSGTKVANTLYDFRFKSGTTHARHRTYLYYCTNTANRQYWAYPRVDVCDGTEPSISDLINGLDADPSFQSTVQDNNRGEPLSIQKKEVRISHINSDSLNNRLVAHWKLNGTGYDSTDNHYNGNVSGTAPSVIDDTTSMDFTSDYIALPNDVGYTSQFSSFCWFKSDGAPTGGYHIIWGGQEMEISIPTAGELRTGVLTSAGRFCTNSGSGLTDGNWHHVGFTFNGTQRVNYIDGQHVGTTAGITGNLTYTFANRTMGRYGASTSYYLNGKLRDARIYDIVLNATEVELLYETTKTYQPELKQSEYGVFTKGKIVGV